MPGEAMELRTLRAAAAVAIAMAALAVGCVFNGEDQEAPASTPTAGTPSATATSTPGSTLEPSTPFRGTLNGYEIVPGGQGVVERSPYDLCPGVGLSGAPGEELATVIAPGQLRIDPAVLPAGVQPLGLPEVFLCRDDLVIVMWVFHIEAGARDVNPGGGSLVVFRVRGRDPIIHSAPRDHWAEVTIGGVAALVARPPVSGERPVGNCFAALYDPATGTYTTVSADGANAEFCVAVMEAVVQ